MPAASTVHGANSLIHHHYHHHHVPEGSGVVGVANELYEVQISGLWVLRTVNNTSGILLLHYHSLLVTQLLDATRDDNVGTANRRIFVPTRIAGTITLGAKQMRAKRKRRK